MSLSQKYEERTRKFSFLARHHFKVELYRYFYIVIFDQNFIGYYINICQNYMFLDFQCIVNQKDFQHKILNW